MPKLRIIRLECTIGGHNKFYEMEIDSAASNWKATYGKIGTTGNVKKYESLDWNKKLREKLSKGYVEIFDKTMDTNINSGHIIKVDKLLTALKHLDTIDKFNAMKITYDGRVFNYRDILEDVKFLQRALRSNNGLLAENMKFLNEVYRKYKSITGETI